MTASAYVFCTRMQDALPAATHSTAITFPLVQDVRPITADWPALADTNGSWIYFDAQIQYAPSVCMPKLTLPLMPSGPRQSCVCCNEPSMGCFVVCALCCVHTLVVVLPELAC